MATTIAPTRILRATIAEEVWAIIVFMCGLSKERVILSELCGVKPAERTPRVKKQEPLAK